MIRPIMEQVAALAEALQVAQPVVAWVMIEMCRGEQDPRGSGRDHRQQIRPMRVPATTIAPGLLSGIEPSPIGQAADQSGMRSATGLTAATGTLEPHTSAEFFPVRRI
jgi:hypothetical protein